MRGWDVLTVHEQVIPRQTVSKRITWHMHGVVLAGAMALTMAPRLALPHRYALERQEIAREAGARRSREIQMAWRALSYTNLTDHAVIDTLIAKIDSPSLGLSDLQRTGLESRLREVIDYLHSPGVDQYYEPKTAGLHYRFELSKRAQRLLANAKSPPEQGPPREPREVAQVLWNAVHTNAETPGGSTLSAVCLDQVAALTSRTNSGRALLSGRVAKGFTVAEEALNPGFEYPGGATATSGDAAQGLFVHLSFFAQTSPSGNAGPVYISLGWSEQDQEWFLSRLITDVWLRLNPLF